MAEDECRDQLSAMMLQETLPTIVELAGTMSETQSARAREELVRVTRDGLDDWERMVKHNASDRMAQVATSSTTSPPRVATKEMKSVTKPR